MSLAPPIEEAYFSAGPEQVFSHDPSTPVQQHSLDASRLVTNTSHSSTVLKTNTPKTACILPYSLVDDAMYDFSDWVSGIDRTDPSSPLTVPRSSSPVNYFLEWVQLFLHSDEARTKKIHAYINHVYRLSRAVFDLSQTLIIEIKNLY